MKVWDIEKFNVPLWFESSPFRKKGIAGTAKLPNFFSLPPRFGGGGIRAVPIHCCGVNRRGEPTGGKTMDSQQSKTTRQTATAPEAAEGAGSASFRRPGSKPSFRERLRPGSLKESLQRFIRFWYLRLLRIKATPHTIAMGLAAGVFVGLLPVLPFQTIIAVALAFVVRGSKIAAALGTWISNPLNWVPLYMLFYHLGKKVIHLNVPAFNPQQLEMAQMLDVGWKFFAVMMAGGLIIALPSAILSYFLAYKGVTLYRRKKAKRQERKRLQQP